MPATGGNSIEASSSATSTATPVGPSSAGMIASSSRAPSTVTNSHASSGAAPRASREPGQRVLVRERVDPPDPPNSADMNPPPATGTSTAVRRNSPTISAGSPTPARTDAICSANSMTAPLAPHAIDNQHRTHSN